jgi:AcrR family transcriptional regulator
MRRVAEELGAAPSALYWHVRNKDQLLPDRTVALFGDLAGLYVGAYAFEESLGLASPTGEDLPPEEVLAMLGEYWASLPQDRFPHTLALGDLLFEGGPDDRFEFGLDVLIGGLESLRAEAAS